MLTRYKEDNFSITKIRLINSLLNTNPNIKAKLIN